MASIRKLCVLFGMHVLDTLKCSIYSSMCGMQSIMNDIIYSRCVHRDCGIDPSQLVPGNYEGSEPL